MSQRSRKPASPGAAAHPSAEPALTPAQQSAAVSRIHENLALRSGAGCGKTYVLARRFTELLLSDRRQDQSPLSRMVALTFTDKAAMEMTDRVRRMLRDFAARAQGDDRRRLLGWLEEVSEARISTIHAFCAALLRAHAIEAGVDPDFSVCADELAAARMIAEASDQALLAAVEGSRPQVAELLGRVSYEKALELVQQLLRLRTAVDLPSYLRPQDTLARWAGRLKEERLEAWVHLEGDKDVRRQLEELAAIPCGDSGDKLLVFRDQLVGLVRGLLEDPDQRTAGVFEQIASIAPGTVGGKKGWENPKDCRDRMKALQAALEPYALYAQDLGRADQEAAAALACLVELALEADVRYSAAKAAAGLLDFDDLLGHTHRLLKSNPSLRKALGGQIDQLLIDECQDTDRFQLELLSMLVQDGTLFVVGDVKQSIYRFRGAQVEVFEDLCRRIGPTHQEHLDESFRTHASGVMFVNELFGRLMGSDYQPIRSHRSVVPERPTVEVILAEGKEAIDSAPAATAAQAAVTAQRIRRMLDDKEPLVWDKDLPSDDSRGRGNWRAVRPGDIAILFGRMTNTLQYERELAGRDIPYYVVAGTGFFKQQEVLDVLNALRTIDNPFDDISLAGTLRSSLFGLDDNALAHMARQLAPPYFWKLQGRRGQLDGLSTDQQQRLATAIDLLADLHGRKDAIGVADLIEELLGACGYEATLMAQEQGRRMLGNVRRLTEQARSAELPLSLAQFIAQTNELVINESRYEQAALASEAQDVVRLMTIHKAKGLEFPVVFVPDLNTARRDWHAPLLNRADWGPTCDLGRAVGEDDAAAGEQEPLSHRIASQRERGDQDREDVRRFYVAVTRHEDYLVLLGANWHKGSFRQPGSYLDRMDKALGIAAAFEKAPADGSGARRIAYGEGNYHFLLRTMQAQEAPQARREKSAGRKLLERSATAGELAQAISRLAPSPASYPLLGPLPLETASVEVAVTALGDFEKCPMLFHWRYELAVPSRYLRGGPAVSATGVAAAPEARGGAALDGATMGTIFHRCMELLELGDQASGTARALVRQVIAEMELEGQADVEGLAADLSEMIRKLQAHELWTGLVQAQQVRRELSFVMDYPNLTLRGQIDLIFQDSAGRWHIVDYKSDQVTAGNFRQHADRYELQMLLYSLAAGRHLQEAPAEATLYFLRPAMAHGIAITPESLKLAERRACDLAAQVAMARRTGQFTRRESQFCEYCPYRSLCQRDFGQDRLA